MSPTIPYFTHLCESCNKAQATNKVDDIPKGWISFFLGNVMSSTQELDSSDDRMMVFCSEACLLQYMSKLYSDLQSPVCPTSVIGVRLLIKRILFITGIIGTVLLLCFFTRLRG